MVSWKAIVLALALSVEALPGKALPKDVKCATEFTTKSIKYPKTQTSTKKQTTTQTKVIIKKRNVTVIPKPTTVIVGKTIAVTTTVTDDAKTDTVTTTLTNVHTSTGTITLTETDTITDTVTSTDYKTLTIATPDNGWIPFDQNPRTVTARSVDKRKAQPTSPVTLGKGKCSKPLYVKVVKCVRTVVQKKTKTVTKTLPGKTTTLRRATKYRTTTKTRTATSTHFPDNVKTTKTVEEDVTVTTIIDEHTATTVTDTATIVVEVPVPYYAVCDSHNMKNNVDGQLIAGLVPNGNTLVQLVGPTPYECCVRCHSTQNCLGSYHFGDRCWGVTGTTCRPGQASSSYYYLQSAAAGLTTLSNGPCGYFVQGGR